MKTLLIALITFLVVSIILGETYGVSYKGKYYGIRFRDHELQILETRPK